MERKKVNGQKYPCRPPLLPICQLFFLSILSSSRTRPCLCPAMAAVAESALVARHRAGRASARPCAVAAAPPRAPVRPPPRIRPPSAGCRAPPACRRASARPSLVAAALHCAGLRATHLQGRRAPSPPALRCLGRTRPTARRATSGLARPAPRRCSVGHARPASHHSRAATSRYARPPSATLSRCFANFARPVGCIHPIGCARLAAVHYSSDFFPPPRPCSHPA